MRLRIIETNFTTKYNWLFKLFDENENDFYIMNQSFYESQNLKSPITKKELDTIMEECIEMVINKIREVGVNNE